MFGKMGLNVWRLERLAGCIETQSHCTVNAVGSEGRRCLNTTAEYVTLLESAAGYSDMGKRFKSLWSSVFNKKRETLYRFCGKIYEINYMSLMSLKSTNGEESEPASAYSIIRHLCATGLGC